MSLSRARYRVTPPTNTDHIVGEMQLDVNGNLKVVSAGTGTSSDKVQGVAADGAAAVGNPVQTGGVDGSGNVQAISVDTSGRQILGAGEQHIGEVAGKLIRATDTFNRPNDATAYAAGDVLSATTSATGTTALRGVTLGRANGGTGYLTYWRITVNHTTFLPRIRVHLYTTSAPTSALNGDNAAMVVLQANDATHVATFDMPALALSAGAGADAVTAVRDDLRIPFACDAADTKLYYRYEVLDAATPTNSKTVNTQAIADVN